MRISFLEAVNIVLTKLREPQVATIADNDYSLMIGELVNEAKDYVENAWDWSALRTTLHVDTVDDQFRYTLLDADERTTLIDALNVTSGSFMSFMGTHWFQKKLALVDPDVKGPPANFGPNGIDEYGNTLVDVFPVPDGLYELKFNVVLRGARLIDDADPIKLNYKPIVTRAYAMALSERGEQGGQTAQEAFMLADQALSELIGLDAHRHPEDLVYRTV